MNRSFIHFAARTNKNLPDCFKNDDVRFTEELATYFIKLHTKPGDVVFDPFAGFGTTLIAAEKSQRQGFGIEYIKERVDYIKENIQQPDNILHGDSTKLSDYDLPLIDFSFTSPPYMTINDHDEYPFSGYQVTGGDYLRYLTDIAHVYAQMKNFLKPGARVMLEVSNIRKSGILTPLAWDVASALAKVLTFERETILCWEDAILPDSGTYGFGYDHSYCLLFRNDQPSACPMLNCTL